MTGRMKRRATTRNRPKPGKEQKIDINKDRDANARFLLSHHGGVVLVNDDGSYPAVPWRPSRASAATDAQQRIEARKAKRLRHWTGARA